MRKPAVAIIAVLACAGAAGAQPSAGPAGSWAGWMQFTRVGGPESFSMALELRGRRAVIALGPGHASRTEVAARISGSRVRLSLPGRPWRLALDGRVRKGRLVGTLRQGPVRGRFQLSRRAPIEGATLGLYRIGTRPLGIVQGLAPRESIDYEQDEIRALYQSGRGRYVVGAGLSTRNPTIGTASFSSNGAVFLGEPATRVPLRQEEVWVRSGRAYLGCTLTIPPGSGRRPAVAFAHGGGEAPRRFNSIQSTYLNHLGLVTLSCDKRGVAQSGGVYPGGFPGVPAVDQYARDVEAHGQHTGSALLQALHVQRQLVGGLPLIA